MNANKQDPWTNEDDAENALPEHSTENAAAPGSESTDKEAAPPGKPDVAADPGIPTLVLPKPEIQPASTEPVNQAAQPEGKSAKSEFPNDMTACLKIAQTMAGADKLSDNPTPAQKARAERFTRLKAHMHRIQQGMPVIHATAHTPGAFVGLHVAGLSETKLRFLARTSREVKALLEERDALKEKLAATDSDAKNNAAAQATVKALSTNIEALKSEKLALVAALDSANASIGTFEKELSDARAEIELLREENESLRNQPQAAPTATADQPTQ